MTRTELCWLSALELGRRIRHRELSPVEVVEAHLERIAALNPVLEAYVTVTADRARAAAERAEAEIAAGRNRGPLDGLPYSLKDVFATEGIRTTAGSKILGDWVPDEDATVVTRLENAGLILLGKVNTHEFAYGVTTQNSYCRTKNPWDVTRIPGGSSGGSAAAVAAGLSPVSLGTDTAGSVRIPAALCGVVGLKPTYGRVSCHGVVAQSYTADHVGPLTRTVADAAAVLQVIAGHDPRDPTSSPEAAMDFGGRPGASIDGFRLGVVRELLDLPLAPGVASAFHAARDVLTDLGASVEEISIPSLAHANSINAVIIPAETATRHEARLRARPEDYGEDVRELLERAHPTRAVDYIQAVRIREQLRRDVEVALTRRVDVILTPAEPIAAPAIGQQTVQLGDDEVDVLSVLVHFLAPFSLVGLPALALPAGFDERGLPVSIQLVGRPFDEASVLQVGHAFEQATEWCSRHPQLSSPRSEDGRPGNR